MPLPTPTRPEYNTTIPSTGQKIRYQPFSVKEEKVLVLAAESKETDEMVNAIRNILRACITHPSDINVDELATFDIEYLFLKTRSKSVGEKIKLKITDPDDPSFSKEHEIDIDKIRVKKDPEHTDTIKLGSDTVIKMKYPGISYFTDGIDLTSIESSEKVVCDCISSLAIGEEVYNVADLQKQELLDWLEGLTTEEYAEIINFFQTMPKLSHSVTIKNTKTGKDFTTKLEGLQDFM